MLVMIQCSFSHFLIHSVLFIFFSIRTSFLHCSYLMFISVILSFLLYLFFFLSASRCFFFPIFIKFTHITSLLYLFQLTAPYFRSCLTSKRRLLYHYITQFRQPYLTHKAWVITSQYFSGAFQPSRRLGSPFQADVISSRTIRPSGDSNECRIVGTVT